MNVREFRAIADQNKIIWVSIEHIHYKLRGDRNLRANDILSGDWDLRRKRVEKTAKYHSIVSHFEEGVAWENTRIFQKEYVRRFGLGEVVRGASNLAELKKYYESKIDTLYEDMKKNGFTLEGPDGRQRELPHVHIGRDGEVMYGSRGNHRLAMANVLRLKCLPCQVRARHIKWQQLRESVLLHNDDDYRRVISTELVNHPDLEDVLSPSLDRKLTVIQATSETLNTQIER